MIPYMYFRASKSKTSDVAVSVSIEKDCREPELRNGRGRTPLYDKLHFTRTVLFPDKDNIHVGRSNFPEFITVSFEGSKLWLKGVRTTSKSLLKFPTHKLMFKSFLAIQVYITEYEAENKSSTFSVFRRGKFRIYSEHM